MDEVTGVARLQYDGRLGEVYRIFLVNRLLTLLTLGVYRFWATTRMRRYLWSHMRFLGDRFEYTGTGGEKFRGFLLAIVVLVVIGAVNGGVDLMAKQTGSGALRLLQVPLALLYGALFGTAVYAGQRYRLSRTSWRGIRGGMGPGALAYGLKALWYGMATGLTLGMLWPILRMRLLERRIDATRFGTAPLSARGRGGATYGGFLLGLLVKLLAAVAIAAVAGLVAKAILPELMEEQASRGTDPTQIRIAITAALFLVGFLIFRLAFGLTDAWFDAAVARQVLGTLAVADLRFATDITGWAVFRLRLGNLLLNVFSLGFAQPIVIQRCARFLQAHIQVLGTLDAAALGQSQLRAPRRGEGLLEALDVGLAG